MKLYFFLIVLGIKFFGYFQSIPDSTVFRSEGLKELEFKALGGEFDFLDDVGETTSIEALTDQNGILYWHRKIKTPVCQTGECKSVYVGLYWYPSGAFLGLDVYDEPLTKTDHSIFFDADYKRLIDVLSSDRSILGEYAYDDLVGSPVEGVDGITGATREDIAAVAVRDAVYTTFTLWHLVHDGEGAQIRNLTAQYLKNNEDGLQCFIRSTDLRFHSLILELLGQGKLKPNSILDAFVLQTLRRGTDPYLKNLAIKSMTNLDFSSSSLQKTLAQHYLDFSVQERVQILSSMGSQTSLDAVLLDALVQGAVEGGEWLAAMTLETVKNDKSDDPRLREIALALVNSEKSFLRSPAETYLDLRKKD